MNIYNLTEKPSVVRTTRELYSIPPSPVRFDLPHPKSMFTDIGFVDSVDIFVSVGEVPSFHWNDVVIVTPEQFAAFKFSCEVWIASGFDGTQYTRICRVQPPVDPSTVKPPMEYDEANKIINEAIQAAARAHKLDEQRVMKIQMKLSQGYERKLVSRTIQLAENPKELKQIINSALGEMGFIFH